MDRVGHICNASFGRVIRLWWVSLLLVTAGAIAAEEARLPM
jgi:hypothetical protein